MTRKEFIDRVNAAVAMYLGDFEAFEPDPHLSVNPVTMFVNVVCGPLMDQDIADADEAIEDAAAAEGDADESATDLQARENPDYYPIVQFLTVKPGHPTVANPQAIEKLAEKYCG